MRLLSHSADFRQILPLLGAALVLAASVCQGQEQFPNELNSPVDEPQVVLPESPHKVPVRPASGAVQQSTDPLVKLAYETREVQRQRLLSTTDHTPWQMMHGLLGLRQDFLINHKGQTINGLEWMQTGPMFENEPWFEKTQFGGRAHPYNKPYAFEGHINQSLAILSMCNVPLDMQFGTPQGPITMRDMLKNAQMTVNEKEEVTWTLWALCTYLPSDAEWINAKGERWSIERLVQVETAKKVGGPTSPCGGTHGLFALARARNVYLRTGKPLRGVWWDAEQKIQKYIETARLNQNANGTLSSAFFKGKEYKQDFDKRMASSGHVLEFLMMALPQERLKEQWVRRAIEATAKDLMANRKAYVSCSPLYHATDALSIYLDRVAPTAPPLVQKPENAKVISNTKSPADASAKPPGMDKTAAPAPEAGKTNAAGPPAKTDATLDKTKAPDAAQKKTSTSDPAKTDAESPLKKIPLPDPSEPESPAAAESPAAVPATPAAEPTKPESPSDPAAPNVPVPAPAPVPVPATVPAASASGPGSVGPMPTPTPDPAPAPTATNNLAGSGSTESLSAVTGELPELAVVVDALKAVPAGPALSPSNLISSSVSTQSLAAAMIFGASAVSRTIVLAPTQSEQGRAQHDSGPVVSGQPVVSGEEVQIKAGLAEGTAPMIQPMPLSRTPVILFTPANSDLASNPDSKVPSAPAPSSSALDPVPSAEHAAAGSNQEPTPESVPGEPKPERHWRATPLERRRPIVIDEPLHV